MIVTLTMIDGTKWKFPRPTGQDGDSVRIPDFKPGWVLIYCANGKFYAIPSHIVAHIEATPDKPAAVEVHQ